MVWLRRPFHWKNNNIALWWLKLSPNSLQMETLCLLAVQGDSAREVLKRHILFCRENPSCGLPVLTDGGFTGVREWGSFTFISQWSVFSAYYMFQAICQPWSLFSECQLPGRAGKTNKCPRKCYPNATCLPQQGRCAWLEAAIAKADKVPLNRLGDPSCIFVFCHLLANFGH